RLVLDPKLLAQILNMSSGRCWSSDSYNPVPGVMEEVPSDNNYQRCFGTTLMAKDLGLVQYTATSTKTPVPLGSLDFSSVFQFLRKHDEEIGKGD
uniref:3-hydroxyisobutyrate dehydrogenase, mitochondrial n=1 Tax=Oncorhynchus kisutch TaxID=8019 RepID=A0A8C7KQV5_ONCKI